MAADTPILDASWYVQIAEQVSRANVARGLPPVDLSDVPESEWAAAVFAPHLRGQGNVLPQHEPVKVRCEYNRWIVDCPFCPVAQAASRTDHWFLCGGCGNSVVGGAKIPIDWPAQWQLIERGLLELPPMERHWRPEE